MCHTLPGCWARAASGHAGAPPNSAMNSRRLTGRPLPRKRSYRIVEQTPSCAAAGQNEKPPFSGLCQLWPAADMPLHEAMGENCQKRTGTQSAADLDPSVAGVVLRARLTTVETLSLDLQIEAPHQRRPF